MLSSASPQEPKKKKESDSTSSIPSPFFLSAVRAMQTPEKNYCNSHPYVARQMKNVVMKRRKKIVLANLIDDEQLQVDPILSSHRTEVVMHRFATLC